MTITVRQAIQAYQGYFRFKSAHALALEGGGVPEDHDVLHLIAGRVPDYMVDGCPLKQALDRAAEKHLEDLVWFKSEVISYIYYNKIIIQTHTPLEEYPPLVRRYESKMNEWIKDLSGTEITAATPALQAIIDRDLERGHASPITDEEIEFHYHRAIKIRDGYLKKAHSGHDIMETAITDFSDPKRGIRHRVQGKLKNLFQFAGKPTPRLPPECPHPHPYID